MQSSRPSRYRALAVYLARRREPTVLLTYPEVERIIGARLPLGATTTPLWWTYPKAIHVRMWREVGWQAHLEGAHRRVRFTRDEE